MKWSHIFLSLFVTAVLSSTAYSQGATSPPLISVTGGAEIRVPPNFAELIFSVSIRHKELEQAQKQQIDRMTTLLKALKAAGIAQQDLQTSSADINAHFSDDYDRQQPADPQRIEPTKILYYTASQDVTCRVRDVKKVPEVITQALKNGCTGVGEATLHTSELRKYRDQARQQALRAAKEKATLMAKELGVSVGRPYAISEGSSSSGWSMNSSRPTMQQQVSIERPTIDEEQASGTFIPDLISVSATVSVSFLIE